mmetsp:Transcript_20710/g.57846  ORF Transcript_20710/g.57846 Transcript_20710/m.57846 type:complete len:281 (-) Transcript_20710:50-892(-)
MRRIVLQVHDLRVRNVHDRPDEALEQRQRPTESELAGQQPALFAAEPRQHVYRNVRHELHGPKGMLCVHACKEPLQAIVAFPAEIHLAAAGASVIDLVFDRVVAVVARAPCMVRGSTQLIEAEPVGRALLQWVWMRNDADPVLVARHRRVQKRKRRRQSDWHPQNIFLRGLPTRRRAAAKRRITVGCQCIASCRAAWTLEGDPAPLVVVVSRGRRVLRPKKRVHEHAPRGRPLVGRQVLYRRASRGIIRERVVVAVVARSRRRRYASRATLKRVQELGRR